MSTTKGALGAGEESSWSPTAEVAPPASAIVTVARTVATFCLTFICHTRCISGTAVGGATINRVGASDSATMTDIKAAAENFIEMSIMHPLVSVAEPLRHLVQSPEDTVPLEGVRTPKLGGVVHRPGKVGQDG